MVVAVQQPPQKRDAGSSIAQAVNIATTLFNVGRAMKADQRSQEQFAEKMDFQREQAGVAKEQADKAARTAFKQEYVPITEERATKLGDRIPILGKTDAPPGFNIDEKKPFFAPAKALAEERDYNQKMAKVAQAEKKAASKEEFDRVDSLADDYRSTSKDTKKAYDGFRRVEAAFTNPNPTGATDLAGIFGFMKTIDPGSTVREGEFANAENAQGVGEQTRNMYNKVLRGERLTPKAREDFLTEAERSIGAQMESQMEVDNRFRAVSEKFGVDPNFVVNPIYEKLFEQIKQGGRADNVAGGPNVEQSAPTFKTSAGVSLTPQQALEELERRKNAGNTAGQ